MEPRRPRRGLPRRGRRASIVKKHRENWMRYLSASGGTPSSRGLPRRGRRGSIVRQQRRNWSRGAFLV